MVGRKVGKASLRLQGALWKFWPNQQGHPSRSHLSEDRPVSQVCICLPAVLAALGHWPGAAAGSMVLNKHSGGLSTHQLWSPRRRTVTYEIR